MSGLGTVCCVDHGASEPRVATQHQQRVRWTGQAGFSLRLQSEGDGPSWDDRRGVVSTVAGGWGPWVEQKQAGLHQNSAHQDTEPTSLRFEELRAACASLTESILLFSG